VHEDQYNKRITRKKKVYLSILSEKSKENSRTGFDEL